MRGFDICDDDPSCQMFCRTQWPSPEEYNQLEVQTSLGRTDIVRWFKDHRSALKNGEGLDWMNAFQNPALKPKTDQEQNGQGSEDISLEVKSAKGELKGWRPRGFACDARCLSFSCRCSRAAR